MGDDGAIGLHKACTRAGAGMLFGDRGEGEKGGGEAMHARPNFSSPASSRPFFIRVFFLGKSMSVSRAREKN